MPTEISRNRASLLYWSLSEMMNAEGMSIEEKIDWLGDKLDAHAAILSKDPAINTGWNLAMEAVDKAIEGFKYTYISDEHLKGVKNGIRARIRSNSVPF